MRPRTQRRARFVAYRRKGGEFFNRFGKPKRALIKGKVHMVYSRFGVLQRADAVTVAPVRVFLSMRGALGYVGDSEDHYIVKMSRSTSKYASSKDWERARKKIEDTLVKQQRRASLVIESYLPTLGLLKLYELNRSEP